MRVHPLDVYQGDDYAAILNVTHAGLPFDLAGYTAAAQVRRQPAESDASVDATFTSAVSGNTITLTLARTVTVALSGAYVWDCQITETASGLIRTIVRGPLTIISEVTR